MTGSHEIYLNAGALRSVEIPVEFLSSHSLDTRARFEPMNLFEYAELWLTLDALHSLVCRCSLDFYDHSRVLTVICFVVLTSGSRFEDHQYSAS